MQTAVPFLNAASGTLEQIFREKAFIFASDACILQCVTADAKTTRSVGASYAYANGD